MFAGIVNTQLKAQAGRSSRPLRGGCGICGRTRHRATLPPPGPTVPCSAYGQSPCLLCQHLRPVPRGLEGAICRREEGQLLKRAAFTPDLGSVTLRTFPEAFRNCGSAYRPRGHSGRGTTFILRSLLRCELSVLKVRMTGLRGRRLVPAGQTAQVLARPGCCDQTPQTGQLLHSRK